MAEQPISWRVHTFPLAFCRNMKTSAANSRRVPPKTGFSRMKMVISELQGKENEKQNKSCSRPSPLEGLGPTLLWVIIVLVSKIHRKFITTTLSEVANMNNYHYRREFG